MSTPHQPQRRAFLIHGFQGLPYEGWRPWLKQELTKKGFNVFIPFMPEPDNPKMKKWVREIGRICSPVDSHCFFVGHSLGCIAILRYLETLPPEQKVGGVVLVAGFADDLGWDALRSFYSSPIDWEAVRVHASHPGHFVAIHSDNDPYVPLSNAALFKKELGAEVIVQHGMGHFSGEEGFSRLPVALESIMKLAGAGEKSRWRAH